MCITIANVTSQLTAQPLIDLLQGKTSLNLEAGCAPIGGSFDIIVETADPEATEEELRGTVMSLMAKAIMKG